MYSSTSSTGSKSLQESKATPGKSEQPTDAPNPPRHPAESSVTLGQAQNEKLMNKKEKLKEQINELHDKIEKTQTQLKEADVKLGDIDASARVQRHIKLLHQYNEVKDIGMALFGVIAERRGVRVKDVFKEFGVGEKD